MSNDTKLTSRLIADSLKCSGFDETIATEIAFHMTDWMEDLHALLQVYDSPHGLDNEEIRRIVFDFLAHVPNHLAAAKKLSGLGPIEDIFGVGVTSE